MKRRAIVMDIDGVILNTQPLMQEILDRGFTGETKWVHFYKNCNRVNLINGVWELINSFEDFVCLVLCTARNEENYEETADKMEKEGIYFDDLYMRGKDDYRQDVEVKRDLLKQIQEKYDIVAFIDDKVTNCEMAKELGILSLRVV